MTFAQPSRIAAALFLGFGLSLAMPPELQARDTGAVTSSKSGAMAFLTADIAMNAAMDAARESLPPVLAAAAKSDLSDHSYMVKWAHPVDLGDAGTEHSWVVLTGVHGSLVEGTLAAQPQGFHGKAGDPVSFPASEISDWMRFRPDGVIEGGYTTRVMISQMSEEERASYDVEFAVLPAASPGLKISAGN